MSLKAETEMAMKLLEKDIHEKQDTIVSLRRQLDDIKSINLEMYRKLQVRLVSMIFGHTNTHTHPYPFKKHTHYLYHSLISLIHLHIRLSIIFIRSK